MARLATTTFDTLHPRRLAEFWSVVIDQPIAYDMGRYVVLHGTPSLAFHYVPDPTPGKNRLHVDLFTDDSTGEIDRLLDIGATLVSSVVQSGASWTVLADPDGNQFCLVDHADPEQWQRCDLDEEVDVGVNVGLAVGLDKADVHGSPDPNPVLLR